MASEAEFTAPHAVCPNPGWWHAPDAESTEEEVTELVAALVRAIQPELVVETGSAFGWTTLAIAKALRRNGHGRLVSLEVDHERVVATTARLGAWDPTGWRDWVELVEGSSLEWTPPGQLQFAFFDSLYELRAAEFRRYRPWMRPGTIVTFHDWTSGLRGHYLDVRSEVEALAAEGLLRPVYVPTPRGLVIAEVR